MDWLHFQQGTTKQYTLKQLTKMNSMQNWSIESTSNGNHLCTSIPLTVLLPCATNDVPWRAKTSTTDGFISEVLSNDASCTDPRPHSFVPLQSRKILSAWSSILPSLPLPLSRVSSAIDLQRRSRSQMQWKIIPLPIFVFSPFSVTSLWNKGLWNRVNISFIEACLEKVAANSMACSSSEISFAFKSSSTDLMRLLSPWMVILLCSTPSSTHMRISAIVCSPWENSCISPMWMLCIMLRC